MNIRTSVALLGALALAAAACKPRQFGESSVKDVKGIGPDYTTQVPVESISIRGEIALPLVKNIKWSKVNQEPHGVTRHHLNMSKDVFFSCHTSTERHPDPKVWNEGCNISIYQDAPNAKSMPCSEKCKKESLVFGYSKYPLTPHYQKVSMVEFTKEDALALFNALNLPVEKQLLMPMYNGDINIPGKILTNIPREINDDVELPKQAWFLQCSLQAGTNKNEPMCHLTVAGDEG
jgi:hypothetical protein